MNILMLSPGFPREMPWFTRGLARVGATVIGVGEQPEGMLPEPAQQSLSHYVQIASLWDEEQVLLDVERLAGRMSIDRVESLWEPGMMLAARIRERLGLPGLDPERTLAFRDKERMKAILDAAGIRTPRHAAASSESAVREAAEQIGYPLILKPIAGAGSADTYRVDDPAELERKLQLVRHVTELSVEEFIDGDEYTFDTISIDGQPAFYNIAWYRPCPLIARSVEWVSPQTVSLREPDLPALQPGTQMGLAVLDALGFETGFTHMEWFLTASGEAVFGEIGARPPGALSVDLMNYASDLDVFTGWAEAVCDRRFSQPIDRRYNAAVIFKRASGMGTIDRIEGLERLVSRYRSNVVCVDLLAPGAARRNWRQTLLSDGHVVVRHPDLQATVEMADRFATDLKLYAQ